MNSKRPLARERRLAAVHEAGHVVIARRVGFKIASAWIMPNAGEDGREPGGGLVMMADIFMLVPVGNLATRSRLKSLISAAAGPLTTGGRSVAFI